MGTATLFRKAIARQLAQITACSESQVIQLLGTPKSTLQHQFGLPLPRLQALLKNNHDPNSLASDISSKFQSDSWIRSVSTSGPFLHFDVQPTEYIKQTLQQVHSQQDQYGHQTPEGRPQTVVIDYSSPNIAKPFHAGHLRSTILGNFIKRSHEAMGYKVVGINYLGDWGKQYGLLAVGFERYGDDKKLQTDPIHHLYEVYVRINQDAATNPNVDQMANAYFARMEQGDEALLAQWRRFRELSIASYASIYGRLNISFEHYSGESETEPYIENIYTLLRDKNLLTRMDDGAWGVSLEAYGLGTPVVRRADGTSLYLTRDLASILLRKERFAFDKAIYVVGSEQSRYLQQVFKIAQLMFEGCDNLSHAAFGRIQGMSTRKGTVVFLKDILDTAQETMLENIKNGNQFKYDELLKEGIAHTPLTESPSSPFKTQHLTGENAVNYIADKLGSSAVIIQDLMAKRVKNYTFAWDRMTASRGYTGVFLQFAYARLCGIQRKVDINITPSCNFELLKEKEALELALTISQFPDIVRTSCETMEPCTLVQYLFKLAHTIGQANSVLRVKDADPKTAEARMLLFWAAKTTLGNGLKLVGIEPLERV